MNIAYATINAYISQRNQSIDYAFQSWPSLNIMGAQSIVTLSVVDGPCTIESGLSPAHSPSFLSWIIRCFPSPWGTIFSNKWRNWNITDVCHLLSTALNATPGLHPRPDDLHAVTGAWYSKAYSPFATSLGSVFRITHNLISS